MERTYKIQIFRPALGDSNTYFSVLNNYTGAKSVNNRFNSSFSDRYTQFLTKEGKMVYTNLPVVIEEE